MLKKIQKSTKLLSLILAVLFVTSVAYAAKGSISAMDHSEVIKIIERPGYFETHGNIFHIKPGEYEFVVTNKAGKNAGFVLARQGEDDQVILVNRGETNNLKTTLKSGEYEYYCPIIPTAKYKIIVD